MIGSNGLARPTTMTTMASSVIRIHTAHWIPRAAIYPICLQYSCRRRAMMSAWASRGSAPTQTVSNPQPPPHDSPPIIVPTSNAPLSPDAASPQTAARPPPAPKMTRPKPTIRAQKAALTLVSTPSKRSLPLSVADFFFCCYPAMCRLPWLWSVCES